MISKSMLDTKTFGHFVIIGREILFRLFVKHELRRKCSTLRVIVSLCCTIFNLEELRSKMMRKTYEFPDVAHY